MLTNLHVKNLALIDEAEVEFGPGLNILTGETGAGKSILIGSINAALGKKMSREMIRTGETSALVELVFETQNPHILELLKEMDLETEDGQVILSRKITGTRSVCRINGEACNVSQAKALAALLLDIHGQHEHQSLLYPERQLAILDAFAGADAIPAKQKVQDLYQEWKKIRKELSTYELDEEARKREAAFLAFEISEIDAAELKEGEDETLETAYRKMGHAKKIAESLQMVYTITGYGAENSAGEQVGRAIRELQQAAIYDDALEGPSQTLSDIDGLLNDFNREISAYLSELTFSEEEYYETEKLPQGFYEADTLYQAFLEVKKKLKLAKPLDTTITKKEISVEQRTQEIKNILKVRGKVDFYSLFTINTKEYIVITFLTILTMSKNKELKISQEDNFSPIIVEGLYE